VILEDKEILGKIKAGDTFAFSRLVDGLKDKAFSLTIKILKNTQEAEDSLQEAFIKLYKAITEDRFEAKSKLSTYFYTIVYNTALDHYKKVKTKRFSIISIDVEDADFKEGDDLVKRFYEGEIQGGYENKPAEKYADEKEMQELVNRYIENLPVQYSVILTMFFINDLSHDEMSKILKLPVGTVKNRIFRAKAKLKELILKKYSEEEILQYV
jgi:RNA polymerase sigma-70 factor (ECF subfamily)